MSTPCYLGKEGTAHMILKVLFFFKEGYLSKNSWVLLKAFGELNPNYPPAISNAINTLFEDGFLRPSLDLKSEKWYYCIDRGSINTYMTEYGGFEYGLYYRKLAVKAEELLRLKEVRTNDSVCQRI